MEATPHSPKGDAIPPLSISPKSEEPLVKSTDKHKLGGRANMVRLVAKQHVTLPGADGTPWDIAIDSTAQHTLSWDEDLCMGSRRLSAGAANLYKFPAVKFCHQEFEDHINDGEGLQVLQELLRQLVANTDFFQQTDSAGANPGHALIVANSDESISLAFEIFTKIRFLMATAHGPGPFIGENNLHILLANARFDEACELLQVRS